MLKRDALDILLAKLDEEYAHQILQMEELAEMVAEVNNAKAQKRRDQLQKMREKVANQAIDDDTMAVINPDIEEAYDFLENESIPDPEDVVETINQRINEELDGLRTTYEALKAVRKATPLNAFFVAEEDDDGDDDDDEDEDDEEEGEDDEDGTDRD